MFTIAYAIAVLLVEFKEEEEEEEVHCWVGVACVCRTLVTWWSKGGGRVLCLDGKAEVCVFWHVDWWRHRRVLDVLCLTPCRWVDQVSFR